jgi:uncharacterized protein
VTTVARHAFAVLAAAVVALTLAFGAAPALAAPTFPPLTGRVVDDAHVLAPATVTDLTTKLAAFEAKTGDQLVVVTLPGLQGYDIEDYGYQLGRAWQIGQQGKNNGVILIVVPSEHKVRIEVGYGLEPVLTDILSNVILQAQVLPKLRTGDYDGGVTAGADAIITQLSADPATAQANVQSAAAQTRHQSRGSPFLSVFAIFVTFIVFTLIFRRHGGGGGGGMGWLLPLMILGSGSRRGGWGGGDWGGGGFGGGGGGFSGGGGSFGGGGASGSW